MLTLSTQLALPRCPHCGVDTPLLGEVVHATTKDYQDSNARVWRFYACSRCGGVVTASARSWATEVLEYFPQIPAIDEAIPSRAGAYLSQARNSISSPSGAVMLAASAVDAMLKARGLTEGSLYKRIDQAASDGLITTDMAAWAHHVRLEANDERHADEAAPLPSGIEARRAVDFAFELAQFMFVLPARVTRGIADARPAS
jgi:hypothetical protein